MSLLGFPLMRYIDVNDSEEVLRAIKLTDPAMPIDFIIRTPGGLVLAIKGQTAADEVRKARPVLRRIGARGAEVVRAGQGKVDPATTVVRFFAT